MRDAVVIITIITVIIITSIIIRSKYRSPPLILAPQPKGSSTSYLKKKKWGGEERAQGSATYLGVDELAGAVLEGLECQLGGVDGGDVTHQPVLQGEGDVRPGHLHLLVHPHNTGISVSHQD